MLLRAAGVRSISVVKTAHRPIPMASLTVRELGERKEWVSLVYIGALGSPELMAMLWVDRNRRYFVATTGSARAGGAWELLRWRQVDGGAERVAGSVPQPEVAEIYYGCFAQIDCHNRCHQDDLRLEHEVGTHECSQRVNISLLGICVVES